LCKKFFDFDFSKAPSEFGAGCESERKVVEIWSLVACLSAPRRAEGGRSGGTDGRTGDKKKPKTGSNTTIFFLAETMRILLLGLKLRPAQGPPAARARALSGFPTIISFNSFQPGFCCFNFTNFRENNNVNWTVSRPVLSSLDLSLSLKKSDQK